MVGKKHIQHLDVLKGMVIFLVIVGHAYHFGFAYYKASLRQILLSLDMPIFMFLAGYLASMGRMRFSLEGMKTYWRKKSIQLLLPLLGLPPLYALLCGVSWDDMIWEYHHGGYWFTLVLFEIFVIYWLFRLCNHRFNKEGDVASELAFALLSLVSVILINHYWERSGSSSYDLFSWGKLYYLYHNFLLGHFAYRYSAFRAWISSTVVVAVCSVAFVWLTYYEYHYGALLGGIPTSLVGVVMMYGLVCRFGDESNWTNSLWASLGKESRALYLTHYFFLFPVPFLKPFLSGLKGERLFVWETLPAILYAMVIIALTLPIVRLIKSNDLLALICYGREPSPKEANTGQGKE